MPPPISRRTLLQLAQLAPLAGLSILAGAGARAAPPPTREAAALAVLHHGGQRLTLLHGAALAPGPVQMLERPLTRWLAPGLAGADDGTLLRLPDAQHASPAWRPGEGVAPLAAARSGDGRWVALLPAGGGELQLLDAALQTVRRWPLPGRPAWLLDAPARQAFVLALAAPAQLWVLSYDERAEDFYDGLVHDFRLGEGVPTRGFLNPRRIALDAPLLAASADAEDTEFAGRGAVVNLDVRRIVARPAGLDPPAAGAAARFQHGADPALALPRAGRTGLLCLRAGDWAPLGEPETPFEVARVVHWPAAGELLGLPTGDVAQLARVHTESLAPRPALVLPAVPLACVPMAGATLALAFGGATAGIAGWRPGDPRPAVVRPLPGLLAAAPLPQSG